MRMRAHVTMIALAAAGAAIFAMPAYADDAPATSAAARSAPVQDGASGDSAKATPPKVHYKSGKDINFEELLIQGQLQRPEITVVTGDSGQGTDGLLRLRENFLDQVAIDTGGEVK